MKSIAELQAEALKTFQDLLDACSQLREAHEQMNRAQKRYADLASELTTVIAKGESRQ